MKLIGRSAAVENPIESYQQTARLTNKLIKKMDCFYDVEDLSKRKKEEVILIGDHDGGDSNDSNDEEDK